MKTLAIIPAIIGTVSLFLSSCSNEELARSRQKNDSLMTVINERGSAIDAFVLTFNEIERNLDSVTAKQHIIHQNAKYLGEAKPNQKDRINAEIESINHIMEENRKMILALNQKIKTSTNRNVHFEKTIAILNRQLTMKYFELATLNDELNLSNLQVAKLQTSVDTLTMKSMAQAQSIAESNTALHTAYYVIGKSKELQDANLVDKQGGLLGIGKTSTLNSNFDKSKFTSIDYTSTKSILINSVKIKIITSHPSDSYSLDKDIQDSKLVTNLVITNPEKFWSVSKFLVVVNN